MRKPGGGKEGFANSEARTVNECKDVGEGCSLGQVMPFSKRRLMEDIKSCFVIPIVYPRWRRSEETGLQTKLKQH